MGFCWIFDGILMKVDGFGHRFSAICVAFLHQYLKNADAVPRNEFLHIQQAFFWWSLHGFFYVYIVFALIFFMNFHGFSSLNFDVAFWSRSWWTLAPKWHPKSIPGRTCSSKDGPKVLKVERPVADLLSGNDLLMPFGRLFASYLCILGPFGSNFAPFVKLLAPFWTFLAQFCMNPFDILLFGIYSLIKLRSRVLSRITSS